MASTSKGGTPTYPVTIPFPAFNSKTAKTYAKAPYRVYEIYGVSKGPVTVHKTWKYGITRQMIPAQRPQGQLKSCTKYFGPSTLITGNCTYQWLWIGSGWLQARGLERAIHSCTRFKTGATARQACRPAFDLTQEDG
jgi:hypothetical protein